MDRRTALKNLFAFIPLGAAFTGLTAMGIRFITPNRKDVYRRIFTVSLDELPVNASRQFQDLQGRDLVIVRTGENSVKALSTVCTHLGCTVY
jgi:Rieske Fe-S protein